MGPRDKPEDDGVTLGGRSRSWERDAETRIPSLRPNQLSHPYDYCGVTLVVVVTSDEGAGAELVVVVRGFTFVRV